MGILFAYTFAIEFNTSTQPMVNINAARQAYGLKELDMGLPVEVHGKDVKDLITKFFYRDNHLCFHILLQLDGGETIFYKEFVDYAEYKKAFGDLQQAKLGNKNIILPKKNLNSGNLSSKVA